MPSHLFNLNRSLTWQDYGKPRKLPLPAPSETAKAAFTHADYSFTYTYDNLPKVAGEALPLDIALGDITITISFNRVKSWVASWVFQCPKQFQDDLLTHEQGHYDIVALMARDLFTDLFAIKNHAYQEKRALDERVTALNDDCVHNIEVIGSRYESETKNGQRPEQQRSWSGFIHTAFTQARQPPELAADGTPYRVRLLEVLRKNGVDLSQPLK